jgi:hypothetical protein
MASHIEKDVALEIGGVEVLAEVHYFYQPPEMDTYTPAGIELEKVMVDGVDKVFLLTDEEIEQLTMTILGCVGDYNERF